jgi:hypothetical protein
VDPLSAFGLFAVTAMLIFYAVEDRGRVYIVAFAGALRLGIDLWIYARRLAVRRGRGHMGRDCSTAMVDAGATHARATMRWPCSATTSTMQ